MLLEPGTLLPGGYEIVEKIGQGGMGEVLLARDPQRGIQVAVKVLRQHAEPERFDREVRAAARIRHPNVVEFLDVGRTDDGLPFFVMEFLDGENLSATISREGAQPPGRACSLTIQILRALEAAHQRGVVHRDLKPSNCLRVGMPDTGEVIKLVDFGIAKMVTEDGPDNSLTRTGSVIGTPNYMSPEQALSGRVDHRSDIYSAGVILFELLTGQVPFTAPSPMGVLARHMNDAPPSPRQLVPEGDITAELEQLVLRALSKKPEERFERAAEFAEALERVVDQARRDLLPTGDFRRPERLYGRNKERLALLEAFSQVANGKRICVLLTGEAGVGKTALAVDALGPRARLTYEKFDKHAAGSQFMALLGMFRQLVQRAMSSDLQTRAQLREDFERELGLGMQVAAQLVPSLEALIGPQAAPAPVRPAESRNRLQAALLGMLRIFARAERPLVLLLDDLQWASAASLDLLTAAMADDELEGLLVIATVRDRELDAASRLGVALHELQTTATVRTVHVGALHQPDVTALVAATLSVAPATVEELALEVFRRTEGNPLFVHQLLRVAHDAGILRFDPERMRWRWSLDQLEDDLYRDIQALIDSQLGRLGETARGLLSQGACIGTEFTPELLAAVASVDLPALHDAMRDAMELDLVQRVRTTLGDPSQRYRFAHDRIRQACHERVPPDALPRVHLRIGRQLAQHADEGEPPLTAVGHLCRGRSLIDDPGERHQLARWALAAARRARGATDYEGARGFLEHGVSLLEPAAWQHDHPLAFALHLDLAEAHYLTGDFDGAEARYVALWEHAASPVDRLELDIQRVVLNLSRGAASDSLRIGLAALRRNGVEVPDSAEARTTLGNAVLERIWRRIDGRPILSLVDTPPCEDEVSRALLRLLGELIAPAHLTEANLADVLICTLVELSLERGHSEASSYAYVLFAFFLATRGDPTAYDFGRLALALNERIGDPSQDSRLHFVFGSILHGFEPLPSALEHFDRALDVGLELGDHVFASYACSHTLIALIGRGDPLLNVRQLARQYLQIMGRTRVASSTAVVKLALRVVACLGGQTDGPTSLGDEIFDEAGYVREIVDADLGFACLWYYVIKLQLHVLEGELQGAEAALREAERRLMNSAWFLSTELAFYRCMLLARRAQARPLPERADELAALEQSLAQLVPLAQRCPQNFAHKELLVRAELAALAGHTEPAIRLYDQAVVRAREDGFVAAEALGAERAAAFLHGYGHEGMAGLYAGLAEAAYERWGARLRAQAVRERFEPLLVRSGWPQPSRTSQAPEAPSAQPELFARTLGISRIFSEEEDFDQLTHRLLEQLVKITKTDRGLIAVERRGDLCIEAMYAQGGDTITCSRDNPQPLSSGIEAPVMPLKRAFWSGELLLIDDAAGSAQFAHDTYLQDFRPRSILCIPLRAHGRNGGLLYLESRQTYAHFAPESVDLVTIAAGQLAVVLLAERPSTGRSSSVMRADDVTRLDGI